MVVGQRGHMEYIWYSAYEPVFWLHHAAVDRLVAMWQQLYPDSWVEPCPAAETTFNTLQGELQDASTLLTPFRSDAAGGFWDSDTARDVTSFGYTYEDLHLEIANVTERKARVTAVVNALYGRGSLAGLVAAAARFKASSLPEGGHPVLLHPQEAGTGMSTTTDWEHEPDLAARLSASAAPLAVLDKHTFISDSGTYTEWVANMRVLDGALGGPFSIHFFLGRVPASSPPLAYPSARNLVGTMSVFAMASPSSPRNVTSTVPLTSALVRLVAARQLATLDEADVVPYLQGKLVYRIVNGREEVVQPTAEMGLWIAVAAATVEAPRSEGELPRWGEQRVAFVVAG
jgi:tyrosinase